MTELTPCETENPMGGINRLFSDNVLLFVSEATLDKTRGERTSHSDSLLCQMILQAMAKL